MITIDYYTADTHFGHARIIELCDRPFGSVEEMNQTMIDNINAIVKSTQTLAILGDACMGKLEESLKCIAQINARVVLVPGNHDRPSRAMQRKGDVNIKIAKEALRYMDGGFDHVYIEAPSGPSVFTAPIDTGTGMPIMMSHYPYEGDSHGEDRHANLRATDRRYPLLHGHVHEEWRYNKNQFNVGVDVNNFAPVSQDEVLAWYDTLRTNPALLEQLEATRRAEAMA